MLNLEQSPDQLWSDVQHLKNTLANFSKLSLLDSHSEKDLFLQQSLSFILSLNWDSLNGGFYQKSDKKIQLSLSNNLFLSEFLFAASQTFFNGDMSYALNNLLNALIEKLYSTKSKVFYKSLLFNHGKVPFVISGEVLLEQLDSDEATLLCSLIDCKNFKPNDSYWMSYKLNLRKASDKSGIHFKQAQILEESIHFKLRNLVESDYQKSETDKKIDLIENCHALSILVSVEMRDKNATYRDYIEGLKNYISEKLDGHTPLIIDETINCCFALIDYCQINYQQEIIDNVIGKLNQIETSEVSTLIEQSKFSEMCSIIKELDAPLELQGENDTKTSMDSRLEVHILTGRNVELEHKRQELLASYNPYQKIFIIPTTQSST